MLRRLFDRLWLAFYSHLTFGYFFISEANIYIFEFIQTIAVAVLGSAARTFTDIRFAGFLTPEDSLRFAKKEKKFRSGHGIM
jgi:hypothetical protein